MLSILLLVTAIVAVVFFDAVCRWTQRNHPPGPFPWPFVGNKLLVRKLCRKYGMQHLAFLELSRRYKSDVISLRLGADNIVIVSGREAVHELLNNEDFDGRPWNEFVKLRNMGMKKGITMNDGPEWRDVRAWVVRTLRIVGFGRRGMLDLITEQLNEVIDKLKDGGVYRLKHVLDPVAVNVLWTLTTGKRLCEESRLEYYMELMDRRTRAFDMTGGILTVFPWIRYIAPETSGYNVAVKVNDEVKSFLMEAITEHKSKYVPGLKMDFIDMFLCEMHNTKDGDNIFTDDQLVMILLDLIIAASQTTTSTLDFLFLNMVVHQDAQRKLQQEIDEVIGTNRLPELEDRPKLPYAEAVLGESQRMWMVTPITGPRRVLTRLNFRNYTIPENTTVLINTYSVNMDPEIYPDPHEFKPERFLKDGVYQSDENAIFFGKGKRRCPGETLARSALFLLFVGVMQKYRFLPVPGSKPPIVDPMAGLTIAPKPYEVLVVPR